jgi:hypothetical protein
VDTALGQGLENLLAIRMADIHKIDKGMNVLFHLPELDLKEHPLQDGFFG